MSVVDGTPLISGDAMKLAVNLEYTVNMFFIRDAVNRAGIYVSPTRIYNIRCRGGCVDKEDKDLHGPPHRSVRHFYLKLINGARHLPTATASLSDRHCATF